MDFGECVSSSNNSISSNLILRTGLGLSDIPDVDGRLYRNTNVFQYAKNAGYTTVVLDSQYTNGEASNGMRKVDLKYVDHYIQLPEGDLSNRDFMFIDEIVSILSKNSNSFIYFNKSGCHFPYEERYPENEKFFTPTMGKDDSIVSSDEESVLNSYRNAVRWSVDRFFEELLAKVDLNVTTILYTSDHGQNIKEFDNVFTHGSHDNPPRIQASVPLLLMGEIFPKLNYSYKMNSTSHFQLFGSLLIMMGYDKHGVKNKYGTPVWEEYSEKRKFVSGSVVFVSDAIVHDFD